MFLLALFETAYLWPAYGEVFFLFLVKEVATTEVDHALTINTLKLRVGMNITSRKSFKMH